MSKMEEISSTYIRGDKFLVGQIITLLVFNQVSQRYRQILSMFIFLNLIYSCVCQVCKGSIEAKAWLEGVYGNDSSTFFYAKVSNFNHIFFPMFIA